MALLQNDKADTDNRTRAIYLLLVDPFLKHFNFFVVGSDVVIKL